jgi:hypothetical protein
MNRASTDIDFHNCVFHVAIIRTYPTMMLTADNRKSHMLQIGNRTASTLVGMSGMVQLTEGNAFFIPQSVHCAVIAALYRRNMDIVRSEYTLDEADPAYNPKIVRPLCRIPTRVRGTVLHDVLVECGVEHVRMIDFNGKMSLPDWLALYDDFVYHDGTAVFDISTTFDVEAGKIPLVKTTPLAGKTCKSRVWPLLGRLGDGHGTVFLYTMGVQDGITIEQTCLYPGGLVHWAKAHGVRSNPPRDVLVGTARARRKLLDAKLRSMMEHDSIIGLMRAAQLRVEPRVAVNFASFDGTIEEVAGLVAMRSLNEVRERYKDITIECRTVPLADYSGAVTAALERVAKPRWSVGFGGDAQISIPAVECRFADLYAQVGVHAGFRYVNLIGKSATWAFANRSPTKDMIYKSGYVWNEPAAVAVADNDNNEPQEERVPAPPVAPPPRRLLVVGNGRAAVGIAAAAAPVPIRPPAAAQQKRALPLARALFAPPDPKRARPPMYDIVADMDARRQQSRLGQLLHNAPMSPPPPTPKTLFRLNVEGRLKIFNHRGRFAARNKKHLKFICDTKEELINKVVETSTPNSWHLTFKTNDE